MERARIRQAIQNLLEEYEEVLGNPNEEKTGDNSGHGFEKEKTELKKTIDLLIEKKAFLENELILAVDSVQKFSLRRQITELETEIQEKRKKLRN